MVFNARDFLLNFYSPLCVLEYHNAFRGVFYDIFEQFQQRALIPAYFYV